jgi:hypothetical protein
MQQLKPCPNLDVNLKDCGCTYPSCDKKGKCCECIRYHRERNELPGCLFPPEVERTYDRSVERFLASRG